MENQENQEFIINPHPHCLKCSGGLYVVEARKTGEPWFGISVPVSRAGARKILAQNNDVLQALARKIYKVKKG